jgi:hypothetical protein
MDITDPDGAWALTDDEVEQSYPHVKGDRAVWTDFRNDPEGSYNDLADPFENNGDIYGHDLSLAEEFIVSNDLSKQLRPAIDGEDVVWLDWRGINPEPKYSEFQVYTRHVGVEMGPERLLAWSSWSKPDLWLRPGVRDGVAAWIAEPANSPFQTAVFATPLTDTATEPALVVGSEGILEAVSLTDDGVVWIGAGVFGVEPLDLWSGQ